uniref:Protein aardvark n=1 Tax=Lygus hesperus TaxID=30085 RepID=A0A0A9Z916_LYGHE
MTAHRGYDRVQLHGCLALSYLCWTNTDNAAQITAHDGYHAVVRAMATHSHHAEVQEHACRALANISHVPLADCAIALEHIVLAMRRHELVAEVQEAACRAMVTISLISPTNKDRLFVFGAANVVIAAMLHFPKSRLVQQEACNALAHLAYEHTQLNRAIT